MPWFTAEQKAEIDHVFAFYDYEKDGEIPVKRIGIVLRSLGVPVPQGILNEKIKVLKANGKSTVDKARIEEMAIEFMKFKKTSGELVESFKCIAVDGGKSGKIEPSRLRAILRNVGEKFSKEMMESMIKDMAEQTDSVGLIDYQAFSKRLAS
eukprot:g685.t1